MLQRIQSVYILLSSILGVVCLCKPIGRLLHEGERIYDVYNLWATNSMDGAHQLTPWVALFVLLLLATCLTLCSIVLFTRRALQMRVLTFCMILLVGYYLTVAAFVYLHAHAQGMSFTPSAFAALPFVCIVLDYLAFRGVLKDETLVRSLDRLR